MDREKAIHLATIAWKETGGFSRYVLTRFGDNNLTQVAGALTFTTLLAMVPLMAICFAILAAFTAFDGMEAKLESFIFENFVPHANDVVREYLGTFRQNVGKLSAVAIVGLIVTAVMLLVTIEGTFNRIFRVVRRRGIVTRLLSFWALLTVGPILFLLSLTLTSALFAMANSTGAQEISFVVNRLARLVPLVLAFGGYLTLFVVLPNRQVLLRDAAVGAIFSAVLFESLKAGFGLYITAFPTYQAIYGAISVLPILLLWIWLVWIVTLAGASITAAMPEWQGRGSVDLDRAPRVGRLAMAVEILRLLRKAHPSGESVRTQAFIRRIRATPNLMESMLARLEKTGYVAETRRGRWVLARELDGLTLYDLMLALKVQTSQPLVAGSVVAGLEDVVSSSIASERQTFDIPLKEILDGGGATPVKT